MQIISRPRLEVASREWTSHEFVTFFILFSCGYCRTVSGLRRCYLPRAKLEHDQRLNHVLHSRFGQVVLPRLPHCLPPSSSTHLQTTASRALAPCPLDVPPQLFLVLSLIQLLLEHSFDAFPLSSSIRSVVAACSCCPSAGADLVLFVLLTHPAHFTVNPRA